MWDEIYRKHYPELLKFAMAACKDRELAEDLAQETFLRALQSADVFEDLGPNQRRAWLYRTLKNQIYDRYRRAILEMQYIQTAQEEPVEEDVGIQAVETAMILEKLPPEERKLFTLRYIEGYNASEISQLLGIPPGTIRAKLSRSRNALKQAMNQ